jgi:hypothetical protein
MQEEGPWECFQPQHIVLKNGFKDKNRMEFEDYKQDHNLPLSSYM